MSKLKERGITIIEMAVMPEHVHMLVDRDKTREYVRNHPKTSWALVSP